MISVINDLEKKCNGCKMCKNICPRNAISYVVNYEGFWFPQIDPHKCIECHLCEKKCPVNSTVKNRTKEPIVYAAWSKDDKIRLASTSGGIFYELARETLNNGGYVAGCIYDNDFKGAKHVLINTIEDLYPLMVSKYVQSDTENIYIAVKKILEDGKFVLFVGAPCHAAALVSYLGKEYDNLLICDFICRGANSPKAHRKYIEYLEKKYKSRIIFLRSKDKRNGWRKFGQSARFENGKEYFAPMSKDLRTVAYHYGNLMMRESCHSCNFKHIPRDGADITLADFWGIDPSDVKDIDKGISLVLLNTENGVNFFNKITPNVEYVQKRISDAISGNPAIFTSATKGKNRDVFLRELDEYPFDFLVRKYCEKKNWSTLILNKLKEIIGNIK